MSINLLRDYVRFEDLMAVILKITAVWDKTAMYSGRSLSMFRSEEDSYC
jgi:hypothetical protein